MAEFKKTGNEDTDAVLAEMAEEGIELPEQFQKPADPSDEDSNADESEDEEELENLADEDDSLEDEDDSLEEDGGEFVPPSRSSVPRQKYEYEQRKRKELEVQVADALKSIEEMKLANAHKNVDEEIRRLAEEEGIPYERAKRLIDLAAAKASNPDVEAMVKELIADKADDKYWDRQQDLFSQEFDRTVYPLILRDNPNATQADVDEVYERLSNQAWTTKAAPQSLVSLFIASSSAPRSRNRVTGEPSRVRSISSKGGFKELNDMTPEDVNDMSDEEFDEYSESLRNRSPKLER